MKFKLPRLEKFKHSSSKLMELVLKLRFTPSSIAPIFSITVELSKGSKLKSDESNNIILIQKDKSKIAFNRRIKTRSGWLGGVEIIPVGRDAAKYANNQAKESTNTYIKMKNVNDLHRELGHPNKVITRATEASMGFKVMGKFEPCKSCLMAEAK